LKCQWIPPSRKAVYTNYKWVLASSVNDMTWRAKLKHAFIATVLIYSSMMSGLPSLVTLYELLQDEDPSKWRFLVVKKSSTPVLSLTTNCMKDIPISSSSR